MKKIVCILIAASLITIRAHEGEQCHHVHSEKNTTSATELTDYIIDSLSDIYNKYWGYSDHKKQLTDKTNQHAPHSIKDKCEQCSNCTIYDFMVAKQVNNDQTLSVVIEGTIRMTGDAQMPIDAQQNDSMGTLQDECSQCSYLFTQRNLGKNQRIYTCKTTISFDEFIKKFNSEKQ